MLDRWSLWCKGATEVIIVGFLLAALGVGLALGQPGFGGNRRLSLGCLQYSMKTAGSQSPRTIEQKTSAHASRLSVPAPS